MNAGKRHRDYRRAGYRSGDGIRQGGDDRSAANACRRRARSHASLTDQELAWKIEGTRSYQELTRRSLATMIETEALTAVEPGRKRIDVAELLPLSTLKAGTPTKSG